MGVRSYRELVGWQKAMELVAAVYSVTKNWLREEAFGLTTQIRRAAVSVPSNIAEGQGRRSSSEFRHHLSIAYGSLMEWETQLLIAQQLEYISSSQADELLTTAGVVGRLLNGLRRSLPDHRPPTTDH